MCEPPREKPPNEEDETESSYYYDDSHGYEDFDPEADEDDIEKEPPTE